MPPGLKSLLQENFVLTQIIFLALLVLTGWIFLRPKDPKSGFRVREADMKRPEGVPGSRKPGEDELANARYNIKRPLQIEGIRIDGPPHEVLGVRPGASRAEILRAYKERMKQYHPDSIARPGTRQWKDAQAIASAINEAKDALLKSRRS